MALNLRQVYQHLRKQHGAQDWWPGDSPFEIMVGAILTQNTAWTNVEKAIDNLKAAKSLDAKKIVVMKHEQLAQLIRPSGYFNIKANRLRALCEWFVQHGGSRKIARYATSELRRELLQVHGVGPETADDILLYAFERPVFVIDAYTRRIFSRLGIVEGNETYDALRELFEQRLQGDTALYNEYHALIVMHGKDICRVKPDCAQCRMAAKFGYKIGRAHV